MGDERGNDQGADTGLPEPQLRAIDALVGGTTMAAAAERAGVGRATLHRWHQDARFLRELNRAKLEHRAEIRGELRALAAQAVQALRDVLASEQSTPAVRVRAAMKVLEAVGVGHPEYIDPPPSPVPQRPWVFVGPGRVADLAPGPVAPTPQPPYIVYRDRADAYGPDFDERSDR